VAPALQPRRSLAEPTSSTGIKPRCQSQLSGSEALLGSSFANSAWQPSGLGWGETRFAAMGANIRTRPSAFEEALDIVRRLLAGETVSSSRRFRVAEASLALRPAEPVEVWIGASAPPAIDRAARLAEGWIASPGLTHEEARSPAIRSKRPVQDSDIHAPASWSQPAPPDASAAASAPAYRTGRYGPRHSGSSAGCWCLCQPV
jgi:Luciferase-like monooxygenase